MHYFNKRHVTLSLCSCMHKVLCQAIWMLTVDATCQPYFSTAFRRSILQHQVGLLLTFSRCYVDSLRCDWSSWNHQMGLLLTFSRCYIGITWIWLIFLVAGIPKAQIIVCKILMVISWEGPPVGGEILKMCQNSGLLRERQGMKWVCQLL